MNKINVIAHTHWDREWYFTSQRSQIYSLYVFDEIINFLNENQKFQSFLLDGQTSILKDYLECHPEKEELLIKLVKENRLIIGPWYTQTDTLVISGESILRNLLLGIKDSNCFGGYQNIGYLPDSFGMSAQLPMIFNQFNLEYAVFRRGIADHLLKDREFIWSSNSGDKIKTFNIFHYGIMAYPPNNSNYSYFEDLINKLKKFNNREPFILFNGEDQKPIRKNLMRINSCSNLDIQINSLENSLKEVFNENSNNLKEYKGEFTFGQHSRTHKSIFSTRADLKIKNNFLERFLSYCLEPLMSLAYKSGLRYEQELIERMWRLMLDNSAHDSIGMCNSDLTNKFIENRYDLVYDYGINLKDIICRRIGDKIDSKTLNFQVYNLYPKVRECHVKCELLIPYESFNIRRNNESIDYFILSKKYYNKDLEKSKKEIGVNNEIGSNLNKYNKLYKYEILIFDKYVSMGYQTYEIEKSDIDNTMSTRDEISNDYIQNHYYCISVTEEGHIKVKGSSNIDEIYLENNGDEGDSYDYSTPSNDSIINKGYISNKKIIKNKFFEQLSFELTRKIPKGLEERKNKKFTTDLKSNIRVRLYKNKKYIEINQKTINSASEHRDRFIVSTKIKSNYSISDNQFSTIIREVDYDKYINWKKDGWDEKPRGLEPMISFAALDNKETVQVVTDGVREYEILDNNKIALTNYRSVPYLGKENLNDRPGRASGVYIKEKGHEMIDKEIESTFYIRDCEKDFSAMHEFSINVLNKPFSYQSGELLDNTNNFVISKDNKQIEKENSLFTIEGNVQFSTLKKAENEDKILLRLFNPEISKKQTFKLNKKFNQYKADECTKLKTSNIIESSAIATLILE